MANGQQQEKGPWDDYTATSGGAATEESGPWQDYKSAVKPPEKSFNEQLTETRPWPKYDPENPVASVGRAALTGIGNFGGNVIKGVEGMAQIPHMLMHPIETITQDIPEGAIEIGREIGEGHPEAPLGQITGSYLTGKAIGALPKIGEVGGGIKDFAGSTLREQATGKLKPPVKAAARVAGAGLGEAVLGSPGGWAGMVGGPALIDAITPPHPNPVGLFSKIPNRMPKSFGSAAETSASPLGDISESVAGTKTRSLVLTPEEARTEEFMQGLAKRRASERGMQFAGGMTPREGRTVPRLPTSRPTSEFSGVRERIPLTTDAQMHEAERILDDPLATGTQKQAARQFLEIRQ